jgi:hypothetical protein
MEMSGQLHASVTSPSISIGKMAGRSPEPVWTPLNEEKSLSPAGIQTPAVQPATYSYADGSPGSPCAIWFLLSCYFGNNSHIRYMNLLGEHLFSKYFIFLLIFSLFNLS